MENHARRATDLPCGGGSEKNEFKIFFNMCPCALRIISLLSSIIFVVGRLLARKLLFREDIETEADVASRMGVIFMSSMFVGVICFQNAIPPGAKERIVFYREQVKDKLLTKIG